MFATRSLDLKPIPYLLALAGATNCRSVATLSGNPQNILIGSFSGINYLDFATALLPIAGVSLAIQIALLYILYPEVRSLESCLNAVPQPYRYPDRQTWLLLAAASTLAGNLTLLGSVANLIVAEAVNKSGSALTFWEHLRFRLPLTIVTLTLTYFWLYRSIVNIQHLA